MSIVAIALLLAQAAGPTPSWESESDGIYCVVKRQAPVSDEPVLVAIRRGLVSSTMELRIAGVPPSMARKAKLSLGPFGDVAAVTIDRKTQPATGDGTLSFDIPTDAAMRLLSSRTAAIVGASSSAVDMLGLDAAFEVLDQCRRHDWAAAGLEAAELAQPAVPAVGKHVQWISNNDLPPASNQPRTYSGFMIWRIETDGSVKTCRFVKTTGSEALDARICELLRSRAKYERPAQDASGHPVPSWTSRWMHVSL